MNMLPEAALVEKEYDASTLHEVAYRHLCLGHLDCNVLSPIIELKI